MTDRIKFTGPTLGSPEWAVDFLDRNALLPGGAKLDAAQFLKQDAVVVTLTAGATAADVSLTVAPLSGAIPSGTILYFAAGKFARTSADVAAGATAIPVEAIPANIANAATATYAGTGVATVPSGTAIGRTLTERNAGTGFGPAAAADDEIFLTAFDVTDVAVNNDVELYRPGRGVKENFLPGFSALAAGVVTKLRALYTMTRGAE